MESPNDIKYFNLEEATTLVSQMSREMQNVNKFAIGAAEGNQEKEQENNCRTGHRVMPPVRTELGYSSSSSQPPVATPSLQQGEAGSLSRGRMSYAPPDRAFRGIRDEDRNDALSAGRRGGMIEWHPDQSGRENESAFTAIAYRREHQIPSHRPPEQLQWRPMTEREWRQAIPTGVLREASARDQLQHMQPGARSHASWAAPNSTSSPVAFRSTSSWSRGCGGFPTVAQINSHNELQKVTRCSIRVRAGVPREVQPISMSSSNGSNSTASPSSDFKVGTNNKRMNEAVFSPPAKNSASASSGLPRDLAHAANNTKRQKTTPPKSSGFGMLDLLW
jgi:hypothetical protein